MTKIIKNIESLNSNFFNSKEYIKHQTTYKLNTIETKLFKIYLRRRGKLLDLCCGAGRVAIPLASKGFDVTAVDINSKLIKIGKGESRLMRLRNIKFYELDAENIDFGENSFDYVIIMENSLQHIPTNRKRMKILKKVNYCLKNDGIMITSFHSYFYSLPHFLKIQEQNLANLKSKDLEFNDSIRKVSSEHIPIYFHFFTPNEIKRLFNRTGFKVKKIVTYNELDLTKNRFKSTTFYRLIWPLLYQFWIIKKQI